MAKKTWPKIQIPRTKKDSGFFNLLCTSNTIKLRKTRIILNFVVFWYVSQLTLEYQTRNFGIIVWSNRKWSSMHAYTTNFYNSQFCFLFLVHDLDIMITQFHFHAISLHSKFKTNALEFACCSLALLYFLLLSPSLFGQPLDLTCT